MRSTLMKRPPHPDDAFFEQAIFDQVFGQRGLSALSSLTSSEVASREVSPARPLLARLKEFLRPSDITGSD
jgi:hypothetical protein